MGRSMSMVESRWADADITGAEASSLNALGQELASKTDFRGDAPRDDRPASVIQCRHDGERWRMIVHNAVGIIGVGDFQAVVKPKIPLAHLLYFLTIDNQLPRFIRDDRRGQSSDDLIELIGHWFITAVESVLQRDLICDYVENVDQLPAARGQLDVMATTVDYYSGRLALTCTFEEYDFDTPLNRMLKAGAQVVAGGSEFSSLLNKTASRILQRLQAVGSLQPRDSGARTERRSAHYDDALLLARLLLRREARTIEAGAAAVWSFLVPTPSVVERAIRTLLADELKDICIVAKRSRRLSPTTMTVNPDLVFEPYLTVGDVKYKIGSSGLSRHDLYQAVAFASAFDCDRALIVSFGSGASRVTEGPSFGKISVAHVCWDADSQKDPIYAGRELAHTVRMWLTSGSSS